MGRSRPWNYELVRSGATGEYQLGWVGHKILQMVFFHIGVLPYFFTSPNVPEGVIPHIQRRRYNPCLSFFIPISNFQKKQLQLKPLTDPIFTIPKESGTTHAFTYPLFSIHV